MSGSIRFSRHFIPRKGKKIGLSCEERSELCMGAMKQSQGGMYAGWLRTRKAQRQDGSKGIPCDCRVIPFLAMTNAQ